VIIAIRADDPCNCGSFTFNLQLLRGFVGPYSIKWVTEITFRVEVVLVRCAQAGESFATIAGLDGQVPLPVELDVLSSRVIIIYFIHGPVHFRKETATNFFLR
jgi:hypothetical protein